MGSADCSGEFRFPFDHGKKCCVQDVKDDNPGPGCQGLGFSELKFQDHQDCCQDFIECPKENAICEKNEEGNRNRILIHSRNLNMNTFKTRVFFGCYLISHPGY